MNLLELHHYLKFRQECNAHDLSYDLVVRKSLSTLGGWPAFAAEELTTR
jgi:hypothetical protein